MGALAKMAGSLLKLESCGGRSEGRGRGISTKREKLTWLM